MLRSRYRARTRSRYGGGSSEVLTLLGHDTFTGANGTDLADHTPEIGTWTDASDTFEIQSNRAAGTGVAGQAVMDSAADGRIELDVPTAPAATSGIGVLIHFVDATNFCAALVFGGTWFLSELTGGVQSQAINSGVAVADGQSLVIHHVADTVTLSVSGVQIATMIGIAAGKRTEATHGLRNFGTGTVGRFDNWRLYG